MSARVSSRKPRTAKAFDGFGSLQSQDIDAAAMSSAHDSWNTLNMRSENQEIDAAPMSSAHDSWNTLNMRSEEANGAALAMSPLSKHPYPYPTELQSIGVADAKSVIKLGSRYIAEFGSQFIEEVVPDDDVLARGSCIEAPHFLVRRSGPSTSMPGRPLGDELSHQVLSQRQNAVTTAMPTVANTGDRKVRNGGRREDGSSQTQQRHAAVARKETTHAGVQ